MKVKVKPLKQIAEEFELKKGKLGYSNKKWFISRLKFKYFGEEVEVFENNDYPQYDYCLLDEKENKWYFRSSWFEQPEEFIKKEEFMI